MGAARVDDEPPDNKKTPKTLGYLHKCDMESAYVTPQESSETPRTYKKRLYAEKFDSLRVAAGQQEMRVVSKWPNVDWGGVWKNMRDAPVSESTRAAWYRVLHD
jgi:hypothetical protein